MNKEDLNTSDVYRFYMGSEHIPGKIYDFYCKYTGDTQVSSKSLLNFKIIIKNKDADWKHDEFNLYPSQLIYLTKVEFNEQ